MSTRLGTQQAPRTGGSILFATFLASLVMLTIAVVAISIDLGRQGETTFVGRPLVNTPLVNTPSELSAEIVAGAEQTFVGGAVANTPSELSGGIRHKYVSDKLGTSSPTELSGRVIGDGLPAEVYARHMRR